MENNCTLCGNKSDIAPFQGGFGDFISCEYCGKYVIDSELENEFELNYEFRNALFHFIHTREIQKTIYVANERFENDKYHIVTFEEIMKLVPQNITELVAKIMINLANYNKEYGAVLYAKAQLFNAIFFINNSIKASIYNFDSLVHMLEELGYIRIYNDDYETFSITFEGWRFIEEFQSTMNKSRKAFIAMSFAENTAETRLTLQKAIRECGYYPMIIDEKEHNKQIVPEILYEIESSDFIVADLTNHRTGVYYEAGYGLGKGKEVILTIHEEDTDAIHFDVNQTNQIRYKTQEDLLEKLKKRIKATIPLDE